MCLIANVIMPAERGCGVHFNQGTDHVDNRGSTRHYLHPQTGSQLKTHRCPQYSCQFWDLNGPGPNQFKKQEASHTGCTVCLPYKQVAGTINTAVLTYHFHTTLTHNRGFKADYCQFTHHWQFEVLCSYSHTPCNYHL